jgi:ketosteroid isomerase-like protein
MTPPETAEQLVRRYYDLVDAGHTDELVALFSDDIDYRRQGTAPISGRDALRSFYLHDRVIESGSHTIDALLSDGAWVAVRGTFAGTLRTGEALTVAFTDWHHVTAGRIDRRESFFPDRAV